MEVKEKLQNRMSMEFSSVLALFISKKKVIATNLRKIRS